MDTDEVGGVVQRCQRDARLDCLDNFVGDQNRICEVLAAVYDTVTNCVDLGHVLDNAPLLVEQDINNCLDCVGMSAHRHVCLILLVRAALMGQLAVDADSLTETLCQNGLGIHVEQLILQGRTACVNNQYFHPS